MVLLGSVVTLLAAAATSQAATVRVKTDDVEANGNPTLFDRVQFVAGPGEKNNLTVDLAGGTYTFTDTGTLSDGVTPLVLTAVTPCVKDPTAQRVTCPAAGTNRVSVHTEDDEDTIAMNANPPNGTFIGAGPGGDRITGGPGNDIIDTGFGIPDPCDIDFNTCADFVDGGAGFNTLSYASRT